MKFHLNWFIFDKLNLINNHKKYKDKGKYKLLEGIPLLDSLENPNLAQASVEETRQTGLQQFKFSVGL